MKKGTKAKNAFSFAHLIGIGAARADGDQDDGEDGNEDERKQREGESDDDYAQRMEELDKKEAGDEDDDDPDAADDDESEKEKAARASERTRCATIFGSKAAASRPDVAAHLAFETDMSAKQAVGMLNAFAAGMPAAAKPKSLGSRMAGVKVPNVGAGAAAAAAAPNATQAAADAIIAAGRARRGEK